MAKSLILLELETGFEPATYALRSELTNESRRWRYFVNVRGNKKTKCSHECSHEENKKVRHIA